MTDVVPPDVRSRIMAAVPQRDSKPEIIVRRMVHALGYRYRLHRRDLPGTPDLVLPRHRKVIFVHGCFWHRHNCRYGKPMPATHSEFWREKFKQNVARDRRVRQKLRELGWDVLVVWECQTKPTRLEWLMGRVVSFLDDN